MISAKQQLEKIYEENKKLELDVRIVGSRAKKLINNCKQALKIIETNLDSASESDLREEIIELEDEFADRGYIISTSYNLGARSYIHVPLIMWDRLLK